MLTELRLLNIVIWGALLAFMFMGAKSAVTGKDVRRGDPMRLGVAWICLVIILSNLRWLLAPENGQLFIALYVFTAVVGMFIFRLAHAYGRGPRL